MTSIRVPTDDALTFETRTADGERIKPGDHRGSPDDATYVEVTFSRTEQELNDCLEKVSGFVRAACAMLGIPLDAPAMVGKRKFPKPCDVDSVVDSAVIQIKRAVSTHFGAASTVNERDPVLRDARRMLNDLHVRLHRVNPSPTVDVTAAFLLAKDWYICSWRLTNSRSNDNDRRKAIVDWKQALDDYAKSLG